MHLFIMHYTQLLITNNQFIVRTILNYLLLFLLFNNSYISNLFSKKKYEQ